MGGKERRINSLKSPSATKGVKAKEGDGSEGRGLQWLSSHLHKVLHLPQLRAEVESSAQTPTQANDPTKGKPGVGLTELFHAKSIYLPRAKELHM